MSNLGGNVKVWGVELLEQVQPGMRVYSVSDLGIGEVAAVETCCFELVERHGGAHHNVAPSAIFVINEGKLTLICEADGLARHRCSSHG